MGVMIQDDFWEAAQAMPERQRAPFLYAVITYAQTGEEPEGAPAWLPTFLVIKRRIELSNEASAKAREKARKRWAKHDGSAACGREDSGMDAEEGACTDADAVPGACPANARHMHGTCTADAAASGGLDAESESESEIEDNPKAPYDEIVQHLNVRTGSSYRATSRKTRRLIRARMAEGFTADDFHAVIDTMADAWGNDPKMAPYLRPETLFGTKFEGYLNRPGGRRGEDRYERYDD